MKLLLRRRPSPALVVACIALFVALGPAAYATHEVINSSDVVDNSLQSVDVKNENLTGADVKGTAGTSTTAAVNGSLTGADISGQPANAAIGQPFVNGSLTGFDVADGSLKLADLGANSVNASKIANDASGADNVNATKLDGLDSTELSLGGGTYRTDDLELDTSFTPVLSVRIPTTYAVLLVSAAVTVGDQGPVGADIACMVRFDGSTLDENHYALFEGATTLPVVSSQGVAAGEHTVELVCAGGGDAVLLYAFMNVSVHL